jgi:hypothetical protein
VKLTLEIFQEASDIMSFEKAVEAIIREAQARGDFENLPGEGKPIDLTNYFNTPEDVRLAQSMLKNAGMVPVEIELLQEITVLKELLGGLVDGEQKSKYQKELREKELQFSMLLERNTQQRKK